MLSVGGHAVQSVVGSVGQTTFVGFASKDVGLSVWFARDRRED